LPEIVLRPGQRLDRYTLLERLATGGMAEVWLARQSGASDFSRLVAIKRILSHLARDPTFVRMFLHEARLAAGLSHPHIAQIFDLGEQAGLHYLAMEYVAGHSLAAIARRGQRTGDRLPVPLLVRLIADAASGLHYAHQLRGSDGGPLGLVHRDVSPQNLLVSYEGTLKIIDFGVAKAATTDRTDSGIIKGKFSYLSPEQCLGHPVDARSDVFALGILLFELSTGTRLFQHESDLMILDRIARQPIPRPSTRNPTLSPRLEQVIMRALAQDPALRHPHAEALRLDLEEWLAAEAPGTHPGRVAQWMSESFPEPRAEEKHLLATHAVEVAPTVRRARRAPATPPRARPTPGALAPPRARPTPGTIVPPRARPSPRPVAPPRSRGTPAPAPRPTSPRWPVYLLLALAVALGSAAATVTWEFQRATPKPTAVPSAR
jgi:serine/threonine protein kinase